MCEQRARCVGLSRVGRMGVSSFKFRNLGRGKERKISGRDRGWVVWDEHDTNRTTTTYSTYRAAVTSLVIAKSARPTAGACYRFRQPVLQGWSCRHNIQIP